MNQATTTLTRAGSSGAESEPGYSGQAEKRETKVKGIRLSWSNGGPRKTWSVLYYSKK